MQNNTLLLRLKVGSSGAACATTADLPNKEPALLDMQKASLLYEQQIFDGSLSITTNRIFYYGTCAGKALALQFCFADCVGIGDISGANPACMRITCNREVLEVEGARADLKQIQDILLDAIEQYPNCVHFSL